MNTLKDYIFKLCGQNVKINASTFIRHDKPIESLSCFSFVILGHQNLKCV